MTIQQAQVMVDGGYTPKVVTLKQGVPATIAFTRVSERGCLDTVQSAALQFNTDLPLDQTRTVTIRFRLVVLVSSTLVVAWTWYTGKW